MYVRCPPGYNQAMKNPELASSRSSLRPLVSALLCGFLFGAAAATGVPGCSSGTIGGNATNDGGGTGGGDDGGTGGGGDGGQSAYCMGNGPPILVGDTGGSGGRCSGDVAASAFRFGLCTCQGLSSGAPITVDSFDSTRPGVMTLGTGGSMGCDADVNVSNMLSVGGNLIVSGSVTVSSPLAVGVDAQVGATLSGDQSITIGRNAQVGSDVKCNNGTLTIPGTLTYPTGKTLTAKNTAIGSIVRAPVTVAPPCDCGAGNTYDIASYVEQRRNSNDNQAIGLDPALLTNFTGDQTLNLTCGRFFLNRIGGSGKVNLNVSGRTALFVGGDVNLTDAFSVTLTAGGELDLFINGGLTSSAPLNFGNKDAPARVRLYMGGSRNINLSAGSVLGGNVYAPDSSLVTSGSLDVYGSVFVRSFNPSAAVKIHHDIAILNASQSCNTPTSGGGGTPPPPPPTCSRCQDCGGQACKAGQCGGACTGQEDCCSPLSCRAGKCVYDIG